MRNVFKSDENLPTTIADTISNSTRKGMRQMADSGQSTLDRGLRAARDLQDSKVVRYAQHSPVKTAGIVIVSGLVMYSLYSLFMSKRRKEDY